VGSLNKGCFVKEILSDKKNEKKNKKMSFVLKKIVPLQAFEKFLSKVQMIDNF